MKNVCSLLIVSFLVVLSSGVIASASSAKVIPLQSQTARYPQIQLYTQPGCRSCLAASDFLNSNNIPFTRKDISQNPDYLEELAIRYNTRAVPVIIVGNDEKVLRGYVQEAFQMAVREVMAKQRR